MPAREGLKVYRYRWVVLFVFLLQLTMTNVVWITFAPITGPAARFYGVSDLSIGLLSMIFMVTFILFSVPASWVIDTYGLKVGVGVGAALTAVFGLTRGLFATDYRLVLASQVLASVGQPFIANAVTTVASKWFPVDERATASGVGTLGMFFGQIIGLAVTPYLAAGLGIPRTLLVYGVAGIAAAGAFFLLAREKPPTPPCLPGEEERSLALEGLRQVLANPQFRLLLVIYFIGLGAFNAISTWIEDIVRPRGLDPTQAGLIGGAMVVSGILGAVVIPLLSDKAMKRKPFFVAAVALCLPGLAGLSFAGGYGLCLASAAAFGFFLLGLGPLGFQYGAELTYPAPEAASNGLLLLVGQISGIAFILGMDRFKDPVTGSMAGSMAAIVGLFAVCLALALFLREPVRPASAARTAGPGAAPGVEAASAAAPAAGPGAGAASGPGAGAGAASGPGAGATGPSGSR